MRGAGVERSAIATVFLLLGFLNLGLSSCKTELLRQQEETIRLQQEEIARQRSQIQDLAAARQREEQKRRDCNRAFRDYFEKAQSERVAERAVSLYRAGLEICPDDDVAHYELGKVLREAGRFDEARREFQAAVKLNPDFLDATRQLEALPQKKERSVAAEKESRQKGER